MNTAPRSARAAGRVLVLGVILAAGLGAGATLAGGPPAASAQTGGSPTETGTSACPSSNPPDQLTLLAGTPQTTTLDTAFATTLQVALTNSDGCPVTTAAAGVAVTFSAPSSGPSGAFSASGSSTVTVGSDASGAVAAPTFTANDIAGSDTVTASSRYGSVSFALTNTAAGIPARTIAMGPTRRSASITSSYLEPLQVQVLDSGGTPVAGATVTFTLGSGGSERVRDGFQCRRELCGQRHRAGECDDRRERCGYLAAVHRQQCRRVVHRDRRRIERCWGRGSGGGTPAASGSATPVSFELRNLAGNPATLTLGVGSTQSTRAGARFPIAFAVTVADAEKNPVAGALVTFAAPASGPSGRFAARSLIGRSRGSRHHRSRVSHPRTVTVKTDACGIAVAPPFAADNRRGGYVVKATVEHARLAAFALVNTGPGPSL